MSEYYGVQRSTSLSHYGVKGMKWGVRKAVEKGGKRGAKKLGRQYAKARRKLDRLDSKANIRTQQRKAYKYNQIAKGSLAAGLVGVAGAIGSHARYQTLLKNRDRTNSEYFDFGNWESRHNAMKEANMAQDYKLYNQLLDADRKLYVKASNADWDYRHHAGRALDAKAVSAGLALGGLGSAVVHKVRSHMAKKRTTPEGHKKAVAERDAFKREMVKTFNQPEVRMLSANAIQKIEKASSKSTRRKIKESLKNDQFRKQEENRRIEREARTKAKQAKAREAFKKKYGVSI